MKKVNPKIALERITTMMRVWGTLRPNSSFYGMTLEEFRQKVKPSLDARAELDAIDERRAAMAVRRDDADAVSIDLMKRVVNAIKADPNEGEDGEVYAALGYVRKGLRATPRSHGRVEVGTPPGAPANATSESPDKAKEGTREKEAA